MQVIDPIEDYLKLVKTIFDFGAIKVGQGRDAGTRGQPVHVSIVEFPAVLHVPLAFFFLHVPHCNAHQHAAHSNPLLTPKTFIQKALLDRPDFKFTFDGLNGVSGPYAKRIFGQVQFKMKLCSRLPSICSICSALHCSQRHPPALSTASDRNAMHCSTCHPGRATLGAQTARIQKAWHPTSAGAGCGRGSAHELCAEGGATFSMVFRTFIAHLSLPDVRPVTSSRSSFELLRSDENGRGRGKLACQKSARTLTRHVPALQDFGGLHPGARTHPPHYSRWPSFDRSAFQCYGCCAACTHSIILVWKSLLLQLK